MYRWIVAMRNADTPVGVTIGLTPCIWMICLGRDNQVIRPHRHAKPSAVNVRRVVRKYVDRKHTSLLCLLDEIAADTVALVDHQHVGLEAFQLALDCDLQLFALERPNCTIDRPQLNAAILRKVKILAYIVNLNAFASRQRFAHRTGGRTVPCLANEQNAYFVTRGLHTLPIWRHG